MFIPASLALLAPAHALAWGDLGHEVTAIIAYQHLTPRARKTIDAMLADDTDPLTRKDFASRATWADKYRIAHRETAAWHFADIEIDHPDMDSACHGFPALKPGQRASQGGADDCVVNKIGQFQAELRDPATAPGERLLALKFLIHFIGDVHQPLHAADHEDRGGNCISLVPSERGLGNLHAYWDVAVVEALGSSAAQIAATLNSFGDDELKSWGRGGARAWAQETFELGRQDVYALNSRPTCQNRGMVTLTAQYRQQAIKDAAVQLRKAAARLAAALNTALGP